MEIYTPSTISTREIQICEFKAGKWGNLLSHKPLHSLVTPKLLRILLIFSDLIAKGSHFHVVLCLHLHIILFVVFCFSPLVVLFWGPPKTPGPALQPEESNTQSCLPARDCNYVTHPPRHTKNK